MPENARLEQIGLKPEVDRERSDARYDNLTQLGYILYRQTTNSSNNNNYVHTIMQSITSSPHWL